VRERRRSAWPLLLLLRRRRRGRGWVDSYLGLDCLGARSSTRRALFLSTGKAAAKAAVAKPSCASGETCNYVNNMATSPSPSPTPTAAPAPPGLAPPPPPPSPPPARVCVPCLLRCVLKLPSGHCILSVSSGFSLARSPGFHRFRNLRILSLRHI
jgi:hypothetical protein